MTDFESELSRATRALIASGYNSTGEIVNIYDLICDLCHLADEFGKAEAELGYRREDDDDRGFCPEAAASPTWGEYAARMGLWHYRRELSDEVWRIHPSNKSKGGE
jgi:hypothetical protein